MTDLFELVHKQNRHHWGGSLPSRPKKLAIAEKLHFTAFMMEEIVEYANADTLEDQLDALVDLVVVALGAAIAHGFLRFPEAISRVVDANMKKIPGTSGTRGSWQHDLKKPIGWRPPDLKDLVRLDANEKKIDRTIDEPNLPEREPNLPERESNLPERESNLPERESNLPEQTREERRAEDADVRREIDHNFEPKCKIHPILQEAGELLNRKSLDYGDPDHSKATYHPFGHASYLQMLHTKMLRLQTLTMNGDGRPQFESARDTVLDLINYAAFYAAWMDEQEAGG